MRKTLLGVIAFVLLSSIGCNWAADVQAVLAVGAAEAGSVLQFVALLPGKTISDADLQLISAWAGRANSDIDLIDSLIQQWKSAAAADKPGIAAKIQAAFTVAENNANSILSAAHVTDKATADKIKMAVTILAGQFQAAEALVPIFQQSSASSKSLRTMARVATANNCCKGSPSLKPADMKKTFNAALAKPSGNAAVDWAAAHSLVK